MASPQVATFINLSINFFRRNNPIEALIMGMVQTAYNVVTFRSRLKLLKYRKMLEFQKLERIERTLNDFNPYVDKGNKMNRSF